MLRQQALTSCTVSVIIVNYNTADLTANCVASIIKFSPLDVDLQIIIVDNASNIDDYKILEQNCAQLKQCTLIRNRTNVGFGAGNAVGAKVATGKYLAFINSDVLFIEDCFTALCNYMEENADVGACGPQILNVEGEKAISHRPFEGVRYKLLGKKFLYATKPATIKIHEPLTKPTKVDFIIGSFMFFDAEAYRLCGGFDPKIFLYYEEFDICFRLRKLKYKTIFLPNISYVHLEGQSGGFNIARKKEHLLSYLYVVRKNLGYPKFIIIKTYLTISYFFKALFKPKYWPLFQFLIFRGDSHTHSLRHKQIKQEY